MLSSIHSIIFICGSLEPGRDGVGDYTRMLAAQLGRLDYSSKIVALYDKEVQEVTAGQQIADEIAVSTLRIPKEATDKERFTVLETEITSTNPSWVSLQFVPYSFNKRGLPCKLVRLFKKIKIDSNIHIMFHELWLYGTNVTNIKSKIISELQEHIISKLIQELQPQLITTSLPTYQARLHPRQVAILPLFGNIPIKQSVQSVEEANQLNVVSFGSAPSEQEFKKLANKLNILARNKKQAIKLRFLGYGGTHKEHTLQLAKTIFGKDSVKDVGPLTADELSYELQMADIGLARGTAEILGKSGSAIAMLEHGVPVLVVGPELAELSVAPWFEDRVVYTDVVDTERIPRRNEPESTAVKVAMQLVKLMQAANSTI